MNWLPNAIGKLPFRMIIMPMDISQWIMKEILVCDGYFKYPWEIKSGGGKTVRIMALIPIRRMGNISVK